MRPWGCLGHAVKGTGEETEKEKASQRSLFLRSEISSPQAEVAGPNPGQLQPM